MNLKSKYKNSKRRLIQMTDQDTRHSEMFQVPHYESELKI